MYTLARDDPPFELGPSTRPPRESRTRVSEGPLPCRTWWTEEPTVSPHPRDESVSGGADPRDVNLP